MSSLAGDVARCGAGRRGAHDLKPLDVNGGPNVYVVELVVA